MVQPENKCIMSSLQCFGLYREYCTHYTDANLSLQKSMEENERLKLFITVSNIILSHYITSKIIWWVREYNNIGSFTPKTTASIAGIFVEYDSHVWVVIITIVR